MVHSDSWIDWPKSLHCHHLLGFFPRCTLVVLILTAGHPFEVFIGPEHLSWICGPVLMLRAPGAAGPQTALQPHTQPAFGSEPETTPAGSELQKLLVWVRTHISEFLLKLQNRNLPHRFCSESSFVLPEMTDSYNEYEIFTSSLHVNNLIVTLIKGFIKWFPSNPKNPQPDKH